MVNIFKSSFCATVLIPLLALLFLHGNFANCKPAENDLSLNLIRSGSFLQSIITEGRKFAASNYSSSSASDKVTFSRLGALTFTKQKSKPVLNLKPRFVKILDAVTFSRAEIRFYGVQIPNEEEEDMEPCLQKPVLAESIALNNCLSHSDNSSYMITAYLLPNDPLHAQLGFRYYLGNICANNEAGVTYLTVGLLYNPLQTDYPDKFSCPSYGDISGNLSMTWVLKNKIPSVKSDEVILSSYINQEQCAATDVPFFARSFPSNTILSVAATSSVVDGGNCQIQSATCYRYTHGGTSHVTINALCDVNGNLSTTSYTIIQCGGYWQLPSNTDRLAPVQQTGLRVTGFGGFNDITCSSWMNINANGCSVRTDLYNGESCCPRSDEPGRPIILDGTNLNVGYNEFSYCNFIGLVTIPDNVTSIAAYAFYQTAITGLVLGSKVETISEKAFGIIYTLTGILSIPNSVISVEMFAFYATNFTDLVLGSNIESIGTGAFYNIPYLTGTLVIPHSVYMIGEIAFFETDMTGLVLGSSLQSIGPRAFAFLRPLTGTIFIPYSLTVIGANAFGTCSSDLTIKFASLTTFNNYNAMLQNSGCVTDGSETF